MKPHNKLHITAFNDQDCTESAPVEPFVAPLNPTTLDSSFQIAYEETSGDSGVQHQQYKSTSLGEFTLELMLDDTGVTGVENSALRYGGIAKAVEAFQNTCYKVDGEHHRPYFLSITYGSILYNCVLTSYSVSYSLFGLTGRPLRAIITATFKQTRSAKLQKLVARFSSPDVTHKRQLKQHESLTGLSNGIYKRNDLYQQIARVNDLDTFRRVPTNTVLYFPPLAKTEE